jgi:hypothetical protein
MKPKHSRRSLVLAFLSLLPPFAAACGDAFCPDCKACPSMCPAGYVCKEATLIEFGGAKSYHCGLAEAKPALTTAPPAPTAPPALDGGVCDAGEAAICR